MVPQTNLLLGDIHFFQIVDQFLLKTVLVNSPRCPGLFEMNPDTGSDRVHSAGIHNLHPLQKRHNAPDPRHQIGSQRLSLPSAKIIRLAQGTPYTAQNFFPGTEG